MSQSDTFDSDDRLERRASLLREPTRGLPESLRDRLLAIGAATGATDATDDAEIDRLYDIALRAGQMPVDAPADRDAEIAGVRGAVVQLLTAVFRDARAVRQVPRRLQASLRTLGGGRKPLPRWIAEPRWAAAACWMLAFALTFGTGNAGALLLEAPTALHSTSRQWSQAAEKVYDDVRAGAASATETSYELLRSRAVASVSWAQAHAQRSVQDLDRAWTTLTTTFQGPPAAIDLTPDVDDETGQTGQTGDSN